MLRPKNRTRMVPMLPVPGSVVVEVGVRWGKNAYRYVWHKPRRMYLVDTWKRIISQTGYDDRQHTGDDEYERMYQFVKDFYKDHPEVTLIRDLSVNAAATFPDECVDIIYLDADHREEPTYNDLCAWGRVLKVGGWMLGHDYFDPPGWSGVKPAVDRFLKETGHELDLLTRAEKFPTFGFIKKHPFVRK